MLNQKPIWVLLNHLLNMVKSKHQSYWFGYIWITYAKHNKRMQSDAAELRR